MHTAVIVPHKPANCCIGDLVESDLVESDSLGNLQFVITEIHNGGEIEISRLHPHERASASELKGHVELLKWLPSYDVLLKDVIA